MSVLHMTASLPSAALVRRGAIAWPSFPRETRKAPKKSPVGVTLLASPEVAGSDSERNPVLPVSVGQSGKVWGAGEHVEKTAEQIELERLAIACRAGDGTAWQKLVLSQHRRVYGICYRFTGSSVDAEDLTQEVFLKVYRNLDSFDSAKGNFTTWLTTLTRNMLVDHFRRTRQDRVTDSIDVSYDGEADSPTMADRLASGRPNQLEEVAQKQLRAKVQHALKQLSPELREAVILRDLQDMDYREIAQVLRVPEGTVKSRISRGRSELARVLQRIEGQVM